MVNINVIFSFNCSYTRFNNINYGQFYCYFNNYIIIYDYASLMKLMPNENLFTKGIFSYENPVLCVCYWRTTFQFFKPFPLLLVILFLLFYWIWNYLWSLMAAAACVHKETDINTKCHNQFLSHLSSVFVWYFEWRVKLDWDFIS